MSRKYTARMLFQDFREAHPDLWRWGADYQLVDFMKILIRSPGVGKFTYEFFDDKITWIEHWEDETETKKLNRDLRAKDYVLFRNLIFEFMDRTGATQQDIADISGVSRQSISKYLSCKSIPKSSTMNQICESLGIEL